MITTAHDCAILRLLRDEKKKKKKKEKGGTAHDANESDVAACFAIRSMPKHKNIILQHDSATRILSIIV
jgi:hypothetical protein